MPETALVIKPVYEIEGHEKYVALKTKTETILKEAKALQIRSQPTMDDASAKKASVKLLLKEIKAVREEYVNPINDRKNQIVDLFKALNKPLEEANEVLDNKLVSYQNFLEAEDRRREEEERKRQEEERKRLEKEHLEAQKKLEEAQTEEEAEIALEEAAETEQKLEEVYQPPRVPPKIAPKIRRTAGGGSVSFRETPKYEVVNMKLLPDEYILRVPDHKKLAAVVKAGVKSIPGVRIWVEKKTRTRTGRF